MKRLHDGSGGSNPPGGEISHVVLRSAVPPNNSNDSKKIKSVAGKLLNNLITVKMSSDMDSCDVSWSYGSSGLQSKSVSMGKRSSRLPTSKNGFLAESYWKWDEHIGLVPEMSGSISVSAARDVLVYPSLIYCTGQAHTDIQSAIKTIFECSALPGEN